jgi:hypothetical protein
MRMRGMHNLILFRGSIDHYITIMWKRKKLVEAPQDLKEDIANWMVKTVFQVFFFYAYVIHGVSFMFELNAISMFAYLECLSIYNV